jgi:hypothetical protein
VGSHTLERSGEEENIAEFQSMVTEVSTSNDPAAKKHKKQA